MDSDNWVVQNLVNALETWNEKLAEIWQLLTQSPENFKGGGIWLPLKAFHVSDAFARRVFPVCSDTPGWMQKAGSPSA